MTSETTLVATRAAARPEAGQPYVIAMPVPNITGELHIGHALNLVIQDVLARHARGSGRPVVFLPGVDHAGLSGQLAAEQALRTRGRTRQELGRDGFHRYMRDWHDRHQADLLRQMRGLGLSADWDQPVSSIDDTRHDFVRDTFVRLARLGMVYRQVALVSWCTRCETCIPDQEIGRVELTRTAYLLEVTDDRGGRHTLATLRPHLLPAATAVLAPPGHPAREAAEVRLPGLDQTLPVVAGEHRRDRTLGEHLSAVLPTYNADDFDAARSRGATIANVFAPDGRMSLPGSPHDGREPQKCDRFLVERWRRDGVLVGTEPYLHGDARHTPCGGAVVPRIHPQWFIRVGDLEDTAQWLLEQPVTRFNHPRWEERYRAVVDGVLSGGEAAPWWEGACLAFVRGFSSNRDWMISRQNWWGIPVPAWHCPGCDTTVVSTAPTAPPCGACGGPSRPSEDVLDVLFHSALWAACVTTDTGRPYHADLAVIGHDILEFWIPTANLLSRPLFGAVSLRDVFVHGVICDRDGQKMSKSAGNAISLARLLAEHGTEATRAVVLDLAGAAAAEQSVALTEQDVGRAAARVDRVSGWCMRVEIADGPDPTLEQELTGAQRDVGRALDALDVGGAYARVTGLLAQLPARLGGSQLRQVAGLIEPFHPQLAAMVRRGLMT